MMPENRHDNYLLFIIKVLGKGILLFLIFNLVVGLIPAGNRVGRVSLYNLLFPGRPRLPFGENPQEAFNLSLYDLEAMFASHEIHKASKPENEFRILLIGDSATWGTLLKPDETLAGLINEYAFISDDGSNVKVYNLAYPGMSLLKDLIILNQSLSYQPDLVIWPLTLESFPDAHQIETPLVAQNPQIVQPLIEAYGLPFSENDENFFHPSFWERSLIGRRRVIFDAIQLQFYGVLWTATGIDQTYPSDYTPAQRDFDAEDVMYHKWQPPILPLDQLRFEIIYAAHEMVGDIQILLVNQPILISGGENSDVRYNFFYPRWVYDQYRDYLETIVQEEDWDYVDLWDEVPQNEFTNSAVHLTARGSLMYFDALKPAIEALINP